MSKPNTTTPVKLSHHQDAPVQRTPIIANLYRANTTPAPTNPYIVYPYRNNTTRNTTHGATPNGTSTNHTTMDAIRGANPAEFSNDNGYTDTYNMNPLAQSTYTDTQSDQQHNGDGSPNDHMSTSHKMAVIVLLVNTITKINQRDFYQTTVVNPTAPNPHSWKYTPSTLAKTAIPSTSLPISIPPTCMSISY